MTSRHVWIDTDMGFDDLAAILMIQHASGSKIVGMSLVAGNAPIDVVRDNAARAAKHFGWQWPIVQGADQPIAPGEAVVTAQSILGADAMNTAGRSLPREAIAIAHGDTAVQVMLDMFTRSRAPTSLLALGPLTNLAMLCGALVEHPKAKANIQDIWWMGGSAGPGNHTAAAEFNAYVDPEAAQIVLDAGLDFKMVGLNACRQVQIESADCEAIRQAGTERAELLADLTLGYLRIASPNATQPMSLYDPTAAAAWLNPNAMQFAPAHIAIECTGQFTRGMTVCEQRVPKRAKSNAQIATVANAALVKQIFHAALRRASIETI